MQKWIFSLPSHPSSLIFYNANPFQKQTLKEEEGVQERDVGNPEKKEGVCLDWLSFRSLCGFCGCKHDALWVRET